MLYEFSGSLFLASIYIFPIFLLLSSVSHGNKFPTLFFFFKVIPSLYVPDPILKIFSLSVILLVSFIDTSFLSTVSFFLFSPM